ncbi:hypothetical protein [Aquabacterium commune]|uniref:hypothetical protein n=1 Tax=Aquabacterium commune TaxID=70586 RepID=UPI003BB02FEF
MSTLASPPAPALGPISREKTARLVSRALGVTPDVLDAGFRAATLADLPAVLALRRRVLGDALTWDDERYVRWRYLPEPGERGLATCWLCTRGHELLGMIGTEALCLQAGDLRRQVHAAMDLMVQPEWAGSGLGVWVNQTVCERLGCVLAIGSNPNSKGVLARTFEALPDRRTHTHPLHFAHFMAKRVPNGLLAGVAAGLADVAMVALRTGRLWSTGWRLSVTQVAQWAPGTPEHRDIETLLQAAQRSDRVEVDRDAATLAHRLLANPRTRCDVWLVRDGARAVGMMATRVVPIEGGRQAVQVLDAVIDPTHQRPALRALLARVTARAFRRGADYLTWTLYDPALEAELKPLMFRTMPHTYETMSWVCPDAAFREAVLARAGWSLSDIHTDRDSA